jgi:hypothetical protein
LVRRDNVEHLLMIGGPGDVVVEPNIVRATASPRELARGPAGIDSLPRAIPLPDSGASWPLQPESNGAARPRLEHYPNELPGRPSQPETPPRHRDTLAALADELSSRPAPQVPLRGRPSITEPQKDYRQEPRLEPRRPTAQPPGHPPAPPASIAESAVASDGPASADQNLADMAQRLEAALRKPNSDGRPSIAPPRSVPIPDAPARTDAPPSPPRVARAPESRPEPKSEPRADLRSEPRADPRPEPRAARPEAKPSQKTAIYDTLEQEMANLLGRPSKG